MTRNERTKHTYIKKKRKEKMHILFCFVFLKLFFNRKVLRKYCFKNPQIGLLLEKAAYGWQLLYMAVIGLNGWTGLTMAVNGCQCLYMVVNGWNG